MTAHGRLTPLLRLLWLMAALSLVVAVGAVAAIANGVPMAKSQALVAVAIMLGCLALLGMALVALPHVHRKKEKNDPRP